MDINSVVVHYCPNCGKPVSRCDLPVPNPTVVRADSSLMACNDVTCKFCKNNVCSFALRNTGCYILDSAAKIAVTNIYSNFENAVNQALFIS
jgi:hypothetical protein